MQFSTIVKLVAVGAIGYMGYKLFTSEDLIDEPLCDIEVPEADSPVLEIPASDTAE